MSEANATKSQLRLASWVRVSTEAQEKRGESLHTQRKDNRDDSASLGGTIVEQYGGQEHGTAGWERAEFDRLLKDAAKGAFDAVVMNALDRWSRDNAKSKEGLDVLRANGVRFFVGTMEFDLFNPEHLFVIEMSATVGGFVAALGSRKSVKNKIERARKGAPVVGKLPFGRAYDRETGEWSVIPEKRALVENIAHRLIDGKGKVSLNQLCTEYNLSHSNMSKVLRDQCGDTWRQEFDSKRFKIHEVVDTPVPRLLPEETINKVKAVLKGNRTHRRPSGRPKGEFVLTGCIFCAACGTSLTADVEHGGRNRVYKHHKNARARLCTVRPRPRVAADDIEEEVLWKLFEMFGNGPALEQAIRAAVPDCSAKEKELQSVRKERTKISKQVANLVTAVMDKTLKADDVKTRRAGLDERDTALAAREDALMEELAEVPTPEEVEAFVQQPDPFHPTLQEPPGVAEDREYAYMLRADRRALVESVFDSTVGGKPAGVYVSRGPDGGHSYEFRGRFVVAGSLASTR